MTRIQTDERTRQSTGIPLTHVPMAHVPMAFYVLDPTGPVDPDRAPVPSGGPLAHRPDIDDRQWAVWLAARDDWLAAKQRKTGSIATLRAYTFAWTDLFERFLPAQYGRFVGPWEVGKAHVTAYQRDLESSIIPPGQRNAGRQLEPATVNARLAAISSYYTYCAATFTIVVNGREVPLAGHNPARAVERAKTTPYEKSHALGVADVRTMLAHINRGCLRGKRDYALIVTYLYTGRRAAEIARLRWGDLHTERGRTSYHWRGKGGKSRKDELPLPAHQAIFDYLDAAGRLGAMADDAYIFPALSDNAQRLPNVDVNYDPAARPLSTGMVNRIIKHRAAHAGLDPDAIHTHTLRHTAAMLRRDAGDDVQALQQFLAHSNLAVTQIYIQHREVRRDTSWSKVAALLEDA